MVSIKRFMGRGGNNGTLSGGSPLPSSWWSSSKLIRLTIFVVVSTAALHHLWSTTTTSSSSSSSLSSSSSSSSSTTHVKGDDTGRNSIPQGSIRGTNNNNNKNHIREYDDDDDDDDDDLNKQCRFFLAESSIPMAGLGVFTAIDIRKGGSVQPTPDICVYVTDARDRETEVGTHTWQDFRFGAQWEGHRARAACEGVVVQFNSMGAREYASARPKALREFVHTHAGLRRETSPGAGAITHYYGASAIALRDLTPGSELLLWDSGHDVHEEHKVPPVRTPSWLRRHGLCIDHVYVKQSAHPDMGRGAHAKRALPAGTVVAPAPLQIFRDRSNFQKQTPESLFVNYCFQPKGSPMLLFPYGQAFGLINHGTSSSRREKQKQQNQQQQDLPIANVELRWSTHHMNHKQWLDLPLEQFYEMQYPGSMMVEVVALRDIEKDEEIFMDYGAEWEEAWYRHVKTWKPDDKHNKYVYPQDMDLTQPFRTVQEQTDDPYPPNLKLVCDTANHDREADTVMEWKPSGRWPEYLTECQILSRTERLDGNDKEASTVSYFYNVSLWHEYYEDETYIDYDVPQSAIGFVDGPYQSDQHLANAFRHPMVFPEDMTPPQWLL